MASAAKAASDLLRMRLDLLAMTQPARLGNSAAGTWYPAPDAGGLAGAGDKGGKGGKVKGKCSGKDTEGDANCTQEAKAAWEARPRNHQAVALPATVSFQECAVSASAASAPAPVIAGAWYPRGGGFSEADLDAEMSKAKGFPVPAGYSGVRYTGPGCLNEAWIKQFAEQQRNGVLLPKGDAYALVIDCTKLLKKHKTLNEITVPAGQKIHVVGDTHGQYWDFLHMLSLTGFPSASNPILFNGDFVDRGSWGMEVVLMIYAFKVMCPDSVHLTRGNHEIIAENILYGFCGETFKKYDGGLFDLFSESFRNLSLCHTINKEIFVMHAGLPGPNPRQWLPGQSHDPEDAIPVNAKCMTLAEIAAISRETELQDSSYKNAVGDAANKWAEEERTIIDLVWGDPRGGPGYGPSYRKSKGVFMFGPDVTEQFCRVNGLKAVIRSHEVKQLGWKQDHPQLYTVFSCPDYMDAGGNQGAFLTLENDGSSLSIKPTSFDKTPHPDLKPMVWQEYMMQVNPHLTRTEEDNEEDRSHLRLERHDRGRDQGHGPGRQRQRTVNGGRVGGGRGLCSCVNESVKAVAIGTCLLTLALAASRGLPAHQGSRVDPQARAAPTCGGVRQARGARFSGPPLQGGVPRTWLSPIRGDGPKPILRGSLTQSRRSTK
ncbi:unnamed protein product [Prorocentrum cordatum]|uniref:Serine/threonine specific protein phosphatases domain-containing protein n=1 Tax=Prorocentrum cordatum TaxID=2364126 RepID=A0ABN9QT71_9DINO|nr:unnamed protein product [Polarella glacialis]